MSSENNEWVVKHESGQHNGSNRSTHRGSNPWVTFFSFFRREYFRQFVVFPTSSVTICYLKKIIYFCNIFLGLTFRTNFLVNPWKSDKKRGQASRKSEHTPQRQASKLLDMKYRPWIIKLCVTCNCRPAVIMCMSLSSSCFGLLLFAWHLGIFCSQHQQLWLLVSLVRTRVFPCFFCLPEPSAHHHLRR